MPFLSAPATLHLCHPNHPPCAYQLHLFICHLSQLITHPLLTWYLLNMLTLIVLQPGPTPVTPLLILTDFHITCSSFQLARPQICIHLNSKLLTYPPPIGSWPFALQGHQKSDIHINSAIVPFPIG